MRVTMKVIKSDSFYNLITTFHLVSKDILLLTGLLTCLSKNKAQIVQGEHNLMLLPQAYHYL